MKCQRNGQLSRLADAPVIYQRNPTREYFSGYKHSTRLRRVGNPGVVSPLANDKEEADRLAQLFLQQCGAIAGSTERARR
jgi:hypothetical protein